jgi:hypothetical protein
MSICNRFNLFALLVSIGIVIFAILYQFVPPTSRSLTGDSTMAEFDPEKAENVYKFKVRDLDNNEIDMAKYQ